MMAHMHQPIEHASRVDAENKLWMIQLRKEHAALLEKIAALPLITERYNKLQESVLSMEVGFATKISNATVKILEIEEALRELEKKEDTRCKDIESLKQQLKGLKQNFIPPGEISTYREMLEHEKAQHRERQEAEQSDSRYRKTPTEAPSDTNDRENRHTPPVKVSLESTMVPQSTPLRDNSPISQTHPIPKPIPTNTLETPVHQSPKQPAALQQSIVARHLVDRHAAASRDQVAPLTKSGSSSNTTSNSSLPARRSPHTSRVPPQAVSIPSVSQNNATPTMPTFRQQHRGMKKYYELVDKAHAQFQNTDTAFEHAFVDKFVQGFYNDENKTKFLRALMQTHRTARKVDGTIYALCEWKDIAEPLRRSGLLPKMAQSAAQRL
ncbi:hypothetical protein BGZ60DRAFT_134803 [Tricladium varicosporioides]|nr:hypothetical protein BGZ60DRAFT_134803 [Hymenoscyphus varicosporioides]